MKRYIYRIIKRKLGWYLKTNRFTKRIIQKRIQARNAREWDSLVEFIETAEKVVLKGCKLNIGIVKDEDDLSFGLITYWPKFERFVKNNDINIHS